MDGDDGNHSNNSTEDSNEMPLMQICELLTALFSTQYVEMPHDTVLRLQEFFSRHIHMVLERTIRQWREHPRNRQPKRVGTRKSKRTK